MPQIKFYRSGKINAQLPQDKIDGAVFITQDSEFDDDGNYVGEMYVDTSKNERVKITDKELKKDVNTLNDNLNWHKL